MYENNTTLTKSANLWLDKDQRRPSRSNMAVKVFERICGGVCTGVCTEIMTFFSRCQISQVELEGRKREGGKSWAYSPKSVSAPNRSQPERKWPKDMRTEAKLPECEAKWRTDGWKPLNVGSVLSQERVGNHQHWAPANGKHPWHQHRRNHWSFQDRKIKVLKAEMPGHTIIKMGKDIETLSKDFRSPQIPLIQGILGAPWQQ